MENNNIMENRNKELFPDTVEISKIVGNSDYASVISSYIEEDNIGIAEYINSKTNIVDIRITAKSVDNYIIAIRLYKLLYKDGKMIKYHTNRWTTKMLNNSDDKVIFKTMLEQHERLTSPGHEWTEIKTISLEGLKIYANILKTNYKILINSNGYIVTNNVELNGATIEKLKNVKDGNDVNKIYKRCVGILQKEFDEIKEYTTSLMPEIELIYNKREGSVIIKLPVLVSTKTAEDNER